MWAALAPYRTASKLDATKPKDTFGLIRVPKPHECKPPGVVARFIYRLFFCPIRPDSLYRCSTCRKIYKLHRYESYICCEWKPDNEDAWYALGGDIQDKES